jgi:hypothetical protein
MAWLIVAGIVTVVLIGLAVAFTGAFIIIAIDSAKGDHDEPHW